VLSGLDQGISLWVALGVAVLFIALFLRARLNYLGIPKLVPPHMAGKTETPDCMVIVPARNEEATIARVVKSFPHDTVIVVDDHSEDGTAEAARKAGAGVLPAPDLGPQSFGKSNACAAGARVLRSRWVLFADADTWFEEGFLDAAVACAEKNQLSFLSIYLQPEFESFSENVLVPCAVALYFTGVSPRSGAAEAVNGQCLLVRREAYDFVGGHSAVITSMIDDVKLAALAHRHRLKFAIARSGRLGHVRFHPDGLWRGFERNAYRFVMVSPWIGITIFTAAFVAALWVPVLVWLAIDQEWPALIAFSILPSAVLGVWYRNPLRALLAPLGICGMFFVILNGFIAAITGRDLEWKGRAL
jgi:glycosyltransferase involved in cell wall biosynthesis